MTRVSWGTGDDCPRVKRFNRGEDCETTDKDSVCARPDVREKFGIAIHDDIVYVMKAWFHITERLPLMSS